MIAAFEEGLDVHDATTERMFRVKKGDDTWEFKRQVSKRLGFGMIYGAGAYTIGNQIEIFTGERVSEEEILQWVNEYRSTYPELGRKSRSVQHEAERRRILRLAGGRVRYFGVGEEFHKAYNQLIQGSVAEMMKQAMVEVEHYIPGCLLLQVHDSVVCEVPQISAQADTEYIQKIVESVFTDEFKVPFRADAKLWATPDGDTEYWKGLLK